MPGTEALAAVAVGMAVEAAATADAIVETVVATVDGSGVEKTATEDNPRKNARDVC